MAFKQIYPQESFGLWDFLRLWLVNVFNDLNAAARQRVFFPNLSKIVTYRWNQFRGTYQGYRQSGSLIWELRQAFYYPRLEEGSEMPAKQGTYAPIRYHDQHSAVDLDQKEEL
jgi:rhamnosyltransferase